LFRYDPGQACVVPYGGATKEDLVYLRTNAPWRDLPEELGNWNSGWRQFRRWSASRL
jgi:hypothetical protein